MKPPQGFAWLPFLIVLGLVFAGAALGGALWYLEPKPAPLAQSTAGSASSSLTHFGVENPIPQTWGTTNAEASSGVLTLHYSNGQSAYVWQSVLIPTSTNYIDFKYSWPQKGDGAYLTVFFGNNQLYSSLGTDFISNTTDEFQDSGVIDVTPYAGQTGQLLFWLNPGGTQPADAVIKNIVFGHLPSYRSTPLLDTIIVDRQTLTLVPVPDDIHPVFYYYKNLQSVYYERWDAAMSEPGPATLVAGADAPTFTIDISNNPDAAYALDDHAVYYAGQRVFTLDSPAAQFRILSPAQGHECGSGPYVMITNSDGSRSIFYNNERIAGADPDSFTAVGLGYSKDKNYVYNGTERTAYDPSTFDQQKAMSFCTMG